MKVYLLCCTFLIAGSLSACSFGHKTDNSRLNPRTVSSILKGITTKEQVLATLGSPQAVKTQLPLRQPPGTAPLPAKLIASEIWTFWINNRKGSSFALPFTDSASHKRAPANYTVNIYFNEQGVVLDCQTEGTST